MNLYVLQSLTRSQIFFCSLSVTFFKNNGGFLFFWLNFISFQIRSSVFLYILFHYFPPLFSRYGNKVYFLAQIVLKTKLNRWVQVLYLTSEYFFERIFPANFNFSSLKGLFTPIYMGGRGGCQVNGTVSIRGIRYILSVIYFFLSLWPPRSI